MTFDFMTFPSNQTLKVVLIANTDKAYGTWISPILLTDVSFLSFEASMTFKAEIYNLISGIMSKKYSQNLSSNFKST